MVPTLLNCQHNQLMYVKCFSQHLEHSNQYKYTSCWHYRYYSVLSEGIHIKKKKKKRRGSKLIACEPNPTSSLVFLGPHSVYFCLLFFVVFSLTGMNWQHFQIRNTYKNPDFQCLLKKSKSGNTFLPGKHQQKPGINSSKGLGVPISLYGVETNLEAGGPGFQLHNIL